jgi:DNA-binding MarR family transcriptional regulator
MDSILSAAEKAKFNIADYYYLTSIYYMDAPNFRDVTEQLGLSKPAISAMVKRLGKLGFLRKVQSIQDKRVFFLELTDKGKRVVEGDNRLYTDLTNIISSLISESQIEEVDCLMEQVADLLRKQKNIGENK